MKMKKILSAILAASMLFAIAGCGKTEKKDDGVVEITMWTKVGEDADEFAKELEALQWESLENEFPNIKINKVLKVTGTDYRQEYDKALMANQAPDVFFNFSYTDISSRIQNGTIADITKLVDNWDMKKEGKVIETFDNVICENDKWYAIPRSAYVRGCIANTKVLADNNFDVDKMPRTWAELADIGSKITDKEASRFGYVLMGMDWCAWPFTNWVWSAGGDMVKKNDDGTYKITFNEEPGVDAAEFWHDMVWKYNMTQKNVLSTLDENNNLISNGSGVFTWEEYGNINQKTAEENNFAITDFKVFAVPTKDESIAAPALAGGEVVTFNPKASEEVLEAAFKVATYLLYDEEYLSKQWEIYKKYGRLDLQMPARSDLYEEKLASSGLLTEEAQESIASLSINAIPEPSCPHWSDLKSQLAIPIQKILLTENLSREEIKALLDDCANTLYELYPEAFRK